MAEAVETASAQGRDVPNDDRFMTETAEYLRTLAEDRELDGTRIDRTPLERLERWTASTECEAITHDSGRFFSIHGLRDSAGPGWPVMKQPEIGILGILATAINGVLHLLMQNKMEPGNIGAVQLSPTVQATRSNYRRIHGGAAVPYLRYFTTRPGARMGPASRTVIVDSLQTEQSSLFHGKRNRNMVVLVDEEVPLSPGWHWLGLDQVLSLLAMDDIVNMEARSVLCALAAEVRSTRWSTRLDDHCETDRDDAAGDGHGAAHSMTEILGWVSAARSETLRRSELMSLRELKGWTHTGEIITHDSGTRFSVIGVSARASNREVPGWDQPMIAAGAEGIVGLLVTKIEGVVHVLLRRAHEPGGFDTAELGPTVQFEPRIRSTDTSGGDLTEDGSDAGNGVLFLDQLLDCVAADRLFDAMASDEGGRFYRTSLRHLIVFTPSHREPHGFRWLSLDQCAELLRFGPFLNCRARSALCALFSVVKGLPEETSAGQAGMTPLTPGTLMNDDNPRSGKQ